MFSEVRSWAIVGLTGVVWAALVLAGVVTGNVEAFSTIADVVPLLMLVAWAFERWGWRAVPRLVGVPVLRGTWQGTIESLRPDPTTGLPADPKVAYLAIEQTLTTISVRLMTEESESDQIAGTVYRRASGALAISYTYLNTPSIDRRDASPIHHGGGLLTIHDGAGVRLEGEYWTERATKGMLSFATRSPRVTRSFTDAVALFSGVV